MAEQQDVQQIVATVVAGPNGTQATVMIDGEKVEAQVALLVVSPELSGRVRTKLETYPQARALLEQTQLLAAELTLVALDGAMETTRQVIERGVMEREQALRQALADVQAEVKSFYASEPDGTGPAPAELEQRLAAVLDPNT